ncbi:MAG TPA: aspartate/glutamate racemase family protein [Candidatus Methylomirabilis sp.]|jgi:arylmalonate decarboxylase
MHRGYSPYGWRARIGLILPSLNVTMEPEIARLMPPGVSVHAARVLTRGKTTPDSYREMAGDVERAAELLETADVDIVAYACTSGSIVEDEEPILERIRQIARAPAVATAPAVVEALRRLNVSAVAVATPYVEFVNEAERKYLEVRGFRVTAIKGLLLGETAEDRRAIGKQPAEVAFRLAREVDSPEAQGLFISCTNFATLPIIALLERDAGKPVVTSVQATAWALLRALSIRDQIPGYGVLLENH